MNETKSVPAAMKSSSRPGAGDTARSDYFAHEYDLGSLVKIRPVGAKFEMFTTPRYRHHYENQEYECYTARLVARLAGRHSLFVDVGANYGFFTFLAATANPHLKAYLLEPVAETIEAARRTKEHLGLGNVHLVNTAASNFDGTASFNISLSADNCAFAAHPSAPPLSRREVPVCRLDTLLAGENPVPLLVKIDVEGHELAVLRGMSGILSRFPDLTIIVECNPKVLAASGATAADLWDALDALGFAVFFLDDKLCRHYRVRHKSDWPSALGSMGYANLYCRRKEQALSVCFFSHSPHLAGAERSLLQLVTELTRDHGALCSVVMPGEGPLQEAMAETGAAVIPAEYEWWGVVAPKNPTPDSLKALGSELKVLARNVLPFVSRIDPDVIWTQSIVIPWGAVSAAILGKPHVWSVCEFGELDYKIQFFAPFEKVLEDVLSSSGLVYVNSRKVLKTLFPQGGSQCRVLYRHIEIPEGQAGSSPGCFQRPGALRLGVFASLREGKGQEDAINAVARLVEENRNVELVLAGYANAIEEQRLGALIKAHKLTGHVRLTGFIPDVLSLMCETDIVLCCSRHEAFGRVGVEAMLLGKPVIYANCLEYMIDGQTGIAYSAGDAAALANGIRRLMDHPEERAQLSAEAERYARSQFNADAYGGEVYRSLSVLRKFGIPAGVPAVMREFVTPAITELAKFNPDEIENELGRRAPSGDKNGRRKKGKKHRPASFHEFLGEIKKFSNRQRRSLSKRGHELGALIEEAKVRLSPGGKKGFERQRKLIAASGLFDEAWYRAVNSHGVTRKTDLIHHYLRRGMAQGCDPNPLFHSQWYQQQNSGIPPGMDPLVHYIRFGRKQGARPNACWDPELYLKANPHARHLKNALRHFIKVGMQEDCLPEPVPEATFQHGAESFESGFASDVRLIAFYLPQFHRIPENDQWWGEGFTEWTNVRGAEPQFPGHYQPHEPDGDLGYYNLADDSVMVRQAELARRFGIHGFCFHHYWFGGKRLLEMPVERLLRTAKPDFPFCLCWANENWTRRWDGADHEVLIAQKHSPEDDQRFIRDVIRFFRDPRYIRINGKPLLIIYRPSLLPTPRATFERWRKVCRSEGVGEIYLTGAQSFGFKDPRSLELDAAVEFPPHAATYSRVKPADRGLRPQPDFQGLLYCYRDAVLNMMARHARPYKAFPAVMPSWDNTARRGNSGTIFLNSNPRAYYSWLRHAVIEARSQSEADERLVFINAWNEWAEGCHLEPDQRYGFAWLNATRRALLAGQAVDKGH